MAAKVAITAIRVGTLCWLSALALAQQQLAVLTPPYFNIAENRPITANATCGEGGNIQVEVYCKLVGFDRLDEDLQNFKVIDGQICDECFPYREGDSSVDFSKTHPASNAVDGDINTHWQSPPISRGSKYNRINMDIDLIQEFQVAYIVVTMADSPRPGVWALEKSNDHGKTYKPWQFFASNDAECFKYFGIHANVPISEDDSVICSTEFSKTPPFEGGEVFVALTSGRPSEQKIQESDVMMEWLRATNIRLKLMHTKTMLGHLMSVAQGDKTVTRRYYYSIKEIQVGGRCICNGHAFVCPADRNNPLRLTCICSHKTAGDMCDRCSDGYTQKKWRKYTKSDPFECEACNCNGHSGKCHYNATVDELGMSMDLNGDMIGGGVCEECQHFTTGINCDSCVDGYYRPPGVLPNATDPCIPCDCSGDPRYTGNCEASTGICECKENFSGNADCTACALGFYDYDKGCKPCDCYAEGTELDENGVPFCVADSANGNFQCPCKREFGGQFCDQCADTHWNFPNCEFCGCTYRSSESLVCDKKDGQCPCELTFGGQTCSECAHGYHSYPDCSTCNCDPVGSELEICLKTQTQLRYPGECLCKEGFAGERCDKCEDGWFGYPNCQPCGCDDDGSQGNVCNSQTGQCQCFSHRGGRKCDQCSPGYFGYPRCLDCNCVNYGSVGDSCNDDGVCTCKPNFMGDKCADCVPNRFNFPRCEECNCNPAGVAQDFWNKGGCSGVKEGELCTCKERVEGRICDTCAPLFWQLAKYNPLGCTDCDCFRPGTLGNLGTCDLEDGHCECKLAVDVDQSRKCDQCRHGFYHLSANNMIGCDSCDCDTGGTFYHHGQEPSTDCNKISGKCPCKTGMTGRRCNEVEAGYYVPTLYQYKFEIEDGYRQNGAPVIFAYNNTEFPDFSWRGYASYSPLQHQVLQNIEITKEATYRMVLRLQNPQDSRSLGTVTIRPEGSMEGYDGEQSHKVVLEPTQGTPNLITVKGELDNFPSPFELGPGRWTVSINIENSDPEKEILIDYFVLLPYEYVEPTILKENIHNPCIREQQAESEDAYSHNSAFCREYTFPIINNFPAGMANDSMRPRGQKEVYPYTVNNENEARELGLEHYQIAEIARWQPELNWDVYVEQPGEHVLAIIYFTPENNEGVELFASMRDQGNEVDLGPEGQAYIYDCPYSTLCRQVVTTTDGQVATFFIDAPRTWKNVKIVSRDPDARIAIERVVLVPLSSWSMDYVSPVSQCVKDKKTGDCLPSKYPDPPSDSTLILMTQSEGDTELPRGIYRTLTDEGTYEHPPVAKLDEAHPLLDISGNMSHPGSHVLVAHYYQPDHPLINVPMVIRDSPRIREGGDQVTELPDIKVYEAVLPLPTCATITGCKAVAHQKKNPDQKDFMITETLNIQFQHPGGPDGAWIEYITAIPSTDWNENLLIPDKIEQTSNFVKECSSNNFYIDPNTSDGFCKESVTSLTAQFNGAALQCVCDAQGSINPRTCEPFGGQCECKENVIGQSCSRCEPNFFGFPDCKPCTCPSTATCNEQTGDCICAPFVEGPSDNPCTKCMENTFGYNPITGCQQCDCQVHGTKAYNESCSLDKGQCDCKDNIEGRTCDHCTYGSFRYPYCTLCDCHLDGTKEKICDQESAACYCKDNVDEGGRCDSCKVGKFNLQGDNPDGCTDCYCSRKTDNCQSSENMQRTEITNMEGWTPVTFNIDEDFTKKNSDLDSISHDGNGNLDVFSFNPAVHNLPSVNIIHDVFYFRSPKPYTGHHIKSYGGNIKYTLVFNGNTAMNQGTKKSPDIILISGEEKLLHFSGREVEDGAAFDATVPLEPRFWLKEKGDAVDRQTLMMAINNLEGIYIRGSYSSDPDSSASLSNVVLDSAKKVAEVWGEVVTSVEQCQCPQGYFGSSCEKCDMGYYQSNVDQFGPVCEPCNCHGHATNCHPITGECVPFFPVADKLTRPGISPSTGEEDGDNGIDPTDYGLYEDYYEGDSIDWCHAAGIPKEECDKIGLVMKIWFDNHNITAEDRSPSLYCHFNPDKCFVPSNDVLEYKVCSGHTEGKHCEKCVEGYFGDATMGYPNSCQACPCPGGGQNFAKKCDSFMNIGPEQDGYCLCKDNYVGSRCEACGPGYFGEPTVPGKECQPCHCNGNINTTDPDACDNISGLCEKCLHDTDGPNCENCRIGTYGDAIEAKQCMECDCNKDGTDYCDTKTGKCHCFDGVEGERCDQCKPDHWGFEFGGCTLCGCSEASNSTQCDQENGQCMCKPGVIGMNCDRCLNGFWNLKDTGCQACTCNTDYAVGGGCNQGTGQCECLPQVIGRDCDKCPQDWLLITNEKRTVIPEWKRHFEYNEGCFQCPSCVTDLMNQARNMSSELEPIREEFREAESSVYAYKRLTYVGDEIERLRPEISLLDPVEGNRRIQPLEDSMNNAHLKSKALNIEYKLSLTKDLSKQALKLEEEGSKMVDEMGQVGVGVLEVIKDVNEIEKGLGIGFSEQLMKTSIEAGQDLLNAMNERNFSETRDIAMNEQLNSSIQWNLVKVWTSPSEDFKNDVAATEEKLGALERNILDIQDNTETALGMIKEAKLENFHNANPQAENKINNINNYLQETKKYHEKGDKFIKDAEQSIGEANTAIKSLNANKKDIDTKVGLLETKNTKYNESMPELFNLLRDATIKADELYSQATTLSNILERSKQPAQRALHAASAYENILNAVEAAGVAKELAKEHADEASNIIINVKNKTHNALKRIQETLTDAKKAKSDLNEELEENLAEFKTLVESVQETNNQIKQDLNTTTANMESIKNLSETLNKTKSDATKAQTDAHDQLASINARATQIHKNMDDARKLQNDYDIMKFKLKGASQSMEEIDNNDNAKFDRVKRQAEPDIDENVKRRLDKLDEVRESNDQHGNKISDLLKSIKSKVAQAREKLSDMKPGVTFARSSHLELANPDNFEELATKTEVSFYVNVSKNSGDDYRAFLFYMGNLEETNKLIPGVITDDFMALQVVEHGFVKLTMDLGAGLIELLSSKPVDYNQWNQIVVNREGHLVSLLVKSEAGEGEVTGDPVNRTLPFNDQHGKPFGSVFTLHPEFSKIFVGGFPTSGAGDGPKIQQIVRSTDMQGQVEGLKIGGKPIGLWNYKNAGTLGGSSSRDKFIKQENGRQFKGNGYVSIDPNLFFFSGTQTTTFKLRFKTEKPTGLIFLTGNLTSNNFIALQLKDSLLHYSYNLGGDGDHVTMYSPEPIDPNVWYLVELKRTDNKGSLLVNGVEKAAGGSDDPMTIPVNMGDLYIGGYIQQKHFAEVTETLFTGCVREFMLGNDYLFQSIKEERNVRAGCKVEVENQVSFSGNIPAFVQLPNQSPSMVQMPNQSPSIQFSFMFRTTASNGLLFHMISDTVNFYYVSLSMQDGSLNLYSYQDTKMVTRPQQGSQERLLYNDNKWHTVSVMITKEPKNTVYLSIDDIYSSKVESEHIPLLENIDYRIYMGGVPVDMVEEIKEKEMAAITMPFTGCIRDAIVMQQYVNFKDAVDIQGANMGECGVAVMSTTEAPGEQIPVTPPTEKPITTPAPYDPVRIFGAIQDQQGPHGQCALPIKPGYDPELTEESGLRFGTKSNCYIQYSRTIKMKRRGKFSLDFKTTEENGLIFYTKDNRQNSLQRNVVALFIKGGKLIYSFNCGSGYSKLETGFSVNDGKWHSVEFSRDLNEGKLIVDGTEVNVPEHNKFSMGDTKYLEVSPQLWIGGLPREIKEDPDLGQAIKTDLEFMNVGRYVPGFVGCIRNFKIKDKLAGRWSKKQNVGPCSDNVERGFFFGPKGGRIRAYPKYRVGLDFDITMWIKPRNVTGLLLAVQGRRDYCILEMVNGEIIFRVDNGRGPITAKFKPEDPAHFCNGEWHELHAVKAKNVVTLSVDKIFAQPGIGVPGVSSTDTNHPLFIGGHARPARLTKMSADSNFVGCVRDVSIESNDLVIKDDMLYGDITAHVCPLY